MQENKICNSNLILSQDEVCIIKKCRISQGSGFGQELLVYVTELKQSAEMCFKMKKSQAKVMKN